MELPSTAVAASIQYLPISGRKIQYASVARAWELEWDLHLHASVRCCLQDLLRVLSSEAHLASLRASLRRAHQPMCPTDGRAPRWRSGLHCSGTDLQVITGRAVQLAYKLDNIQIPTRLADTSYIDDAMELLACTFYREIQRLQLLHDHQFDHTHRLPPINPNQCPYHFIHTLSISARRRIRAIREDPMRPVCLRTPLSIVLPEYRIVEANISRLTQQRYHRNRAISLIMH